MNMFRLLRLQYTTLKRANVDFGQIGARAVAVSFVSTPLFGMLYVSALSSGRHLPWWACALLALFLTSLCLLASRPEPDAGAPARGEMNRFKLMTLDVILVLSLLAIASWSLIAALVIYVSIMQLNVEKWLR